MLKHILALFLLNLFFRNVLIVALFQPMRLGDVI